MIYIAKTYYPDLKAHIALVQSLKLGNTVLVYFTEIINIYKWMNSKRKHRPQLSWMLDLDFPKNTSIGVLLIRSQQLPHDFQCHTSLCKSANFKNHGLRLHNAFKIKLHRPQLVGFSKGTALPYLFQSWRCNFNLNSILQIYTCDPLPLITKASATRRSMYKGSSFVERSSIPAFAYMLMASL